MSDIVITDYSPDWPKLYEEIAEPVRTAVTGLGARVEHVGSTSVPGLRAKPVIDIDVVVQRVSDVPAAIERLRSLGYAHNGDQGIPGREAFRWPDGAPRHHLYIVVEGNQAHRDHVDFRDYLRTHADVAHQYAELKTRLAREHRADRVGYTDAKDAFVSEILERAREVS